MITHNGKKIDYTEYGQGPAILFIPGSFSTPAAWTPIQKLLPKDYRFISTSLCGYGTTEERRSIKNFRMDNQIEIIEAVVDKIGEPVHLVGHSFGGMVALASALSGKFNVLSITTFEANPVTIIDPFQHHQLFEKTKKIKEDYEAAFHAGKEDAVRIIIDFWGGDGSFAAMPEVVQEYCRQTAFSNVLDWHTAFSFSAKIDDYANLSMPVLLVRGAHANKQMLVITEALQTCIPNQRSAVIDGSGHFLITSHPNDCAIVLADFLREIILE